jgi:hypothetical protein
MQSVMFNIYQGWWLETGFKLFFKSNDVNKVKFIFLEERNITLNVLESKCIAKFFCDFFTVGT